MPRNPMCPNARRRRSTSAFLPAFAAGIVACLLVACSGSHARASESALEPGDAVTFQATHDASIAGFNPEDQSTENFGDEPTLNVRRNADPRRESRALIRFDLPEGPPAFDVAELQLRWLREGFSERYVLWGRVESENNTQAGEWDESEVTWRSAMGSAPQADALASPPNDGFVRLLTFDTPHTPRDFLLRSDSLTEMVRDDNDGRLTFLITAANQSKRLGRFASSEFAAADTGDEESTGGGPSLTLRRSAPLAFPGAEGFGARAKGGRGGRVYTVTTLEDYDPTTDKPIPGSFRAAVTAEGPRTVVFAVAGDIHLKAYLEIDQSYLTIAGQTAPGDGICIRGKGVRIGSTSKPVHDVIVRYLRFRTGPGKRKGDSPDTLNINNAQRVIVDHCTVSWGVDECLSITEHPFPYKKAGRVLNPDFKGPASLTEDITIQWSIVAEGLDDSTHEKGPHSKGLMVAYGPSRFTLHHNLIAHNVDRNPYLPAEGKDPWIADVRNNLVYNWGRATAVAYPKINHNGQINFVGNRYIPGPNSRRTPAMIMNVRSKVYLHDNLGAVRRSPDMPESRAMRGHGIQVDKPFDTPPVTTHAASKLEELVLPRVGASLPNRDAADARLVEEVRRREGRIIDDPSEVGGWPELKSGKPAPDTDGDGMADAWELKQGLDPEDASDGPRVADPRGYTNLELYLHALTRPAS